MPFRKILATLALLAFGASAHAGIEKDDANLSLFGALTSTDDTDTLTVQLAGGYFYTETLELQGTILASYTDSSSFETTVTGYGVNANLYLPGNNPDIIPFVGGGATIVLVDSGGFSETEFGINAQAGIKQFLTEQVALNYQAQIVSAGDYDATILSVGFSIFLE